MHAALGLALGLGGLVVILTAVCTLTSVITLLHRRSRRKSTIVHIGEFKGVLS